MKRNNVYIETFGCQMNVADSERAATGLSRAGFSVVASLADADIVILNTCSVRAKAEHKVISRIGEIARQREGRFPVLGVMGCVAQLEGASIFRQNPKIQVVIGTRATDRIPDLIERVRNGEQHVIDLDERSQISTWDIDTLRRGSHHVAFVPIIEGCNKFCTYCIVPYSRGREKSRPPKEIIDEVARLKNEGYKEVQLIGQNVNSYRPINQAELSRFDGSTPFSRLLRAVAATGVSRVKFTTSFPRDFHADIVKAIEDNANLCNWIHLPVQSGNDRILRTMRRGYRRDDYLKCVDVIKSAKRNIALTSDIIIGFPGEELEEFNDTIRLVERCRFDGLYIFKYSARSGTPAAKLFDDVTPALKTYRFMELERKQRLIQSEIYQAYVGQSFEVLVEGRSAKSDMELTGHTTCHKVINFPGDTGLIGSIVAVRITRANNNSLSGELV